MRRLFLSLFFVAACQSSDSSRAPIDGIDDAGVDTGPAPIPGSDASLPPIPGSDGSLPPSTDASATPEPDYRERGSLSVASKVQNFAGTRCSFAYESFTPATTSTEAKVLIAPGFAIGPGLGSSRVALKTLATHIASWGVTTYTVDLCTNGGSIDHSKNGAAMAELGEQLGGARMIYAGFSAGGLGAMIAASVAKNTAAFLALDAVDKDDLAKAALVAIKAPVYAMAGEPSQCNSNENMLAQYQGRAMPVLKVNKAQHFTFEGAPCEGIKCLPCAGGGELEATAIRALATSFVLGVSGADAKALSWWQDGSAGWKALSEGGVVTRMQ